MSLSDEEREKVEREVEITCDVAATVMSSLAKETGVSAEDIPIEAKQVRDLIARCLEMVKAMRAPSRSEMMRRKIAGGTDGA